MNKKSRAEGCFSEDDVRCLAERLTQYWQRLPEHEKHSLFEILLRAMEPLDRFRYLKTSDLLNADEEATLHSLEKESKRE
jgi:hypothetical protein